MQPNLAIIEGKSQQEKVGSDAAAGPMIHEVKELRSSGMRRRLIRRQSWARHVAPSLRFLNS